MESTFAFTCDELPVAQAWASDQLAAWGVGTSHAARWLARGSELLGPGRDGVAVLCYDPAERVVALDVWCDGARLFGMDDLV